MFVALGGSEGYGGLRQIEERKSGWCGSFSPEWSSFYIFKGYVYTDIRMMAIDSFKKETLSGPMISGYLQYVWEPWSGWLAKNT